MLLLCVTHAYADVGRHLEAVQTVLSNCGMRIVVKLYKGNVVSVGNQPHLHTAISTTPCVLSHTYLLETLVLPKQHLQHHF